QLAAAGSSLDRQKIAMRLDDQAPAQERLLRSGTRPELRLLDAAAQTRIVCVAGIRLDSRKSVRPFKGIICPDISEFEPHMLSQTSRSLWAMPDLLPCRPRALF